MRAFFRDEIIKEQTLRLNFNEAHYRYLPQNLKQALEEPPTRYEIYPKIILFANSSNFQPNSSLMMPSLIDNGGESDNLIMGLKDDYFKKLDPKVKATLFDDVDTFDCCEEDYNQIMLEKAACNTSKTNNSTKTSEEEE